MIRQVIKAFIIVLLLHSNVAYAKLNFYFFYPDSPVNNMAQLKKEMDELFHNANIDINFQPFVRISDFKNEIAKNNNKVIILSPKWAISDINDTKILLKSFNKGRSTYNKVLIVKSTSALTLEKLTGTTHAMTTLGSDTALFKTIWLNKFSADNIHVIEVNKDIDAMFAVALAQVDSALVTRSSINRVKELNPRIVDSIKVIAVTKPFPLPPIMSILGVGVDKEITEFVQLIKNLEKQNPFQQLLNIDEWRDEK